MIMYHVCIKIKYIYRYYIYLYGKMKLRSFLKNIIQLNNNNMFN